MAQTSNASTYLNEVKNVLLTPTERGVATKIVMRAALFLQKPTLTLPKRYVMVHVFLKNRKLPGNSTNPGTWLNGLALSIIRREVHNAIDQETSSPDGDGISD
jgi:hypothetical protein